MKIELFFILELENVSAQFEVVDKASMNLGGAIVRSKHHRNFLDISNDSKFNIFIFNQPSVIFLTQSRQVHFCGTSYWPPLPGHTIDSRLEWCGPALPCLSYSGLC